MSRDIISVQTADIFECIDTDIIRKIAASLVNGSLDYSTFEQVISERLNSMWYGAHESEYAILGSAMALFKKLEVPIPQGLLATEYVQKYTMDYYLVDTY